MKLTNKKILGGVIALLAIVSLAQTQAILQIAKASNVNRTSVLAQVSSEDQAAQVLNTARGCVEVLPPSENRSDFIDPDPSWGTLSFAHEFVSGIKIRNRCNYPVSIIRDFIGVNPQSPTPGFTNLIPIVKLQDWPNLDSQSTTEGIYFFYGPTPVETSTISQHLGADIAIPAQAMNGVPSSYPADAEYNSEWTYTIPAQSSRDFVFDGIILNIWDSENSFPTHYTRLSINKFRWFKTSDYTDGTSLTANEVKTFTLPVDSYVSSFAKFEYPTEGMQLEGANKTQATKAKSRIDSLIKEQISK
jgi:hypothetical protein